MYCQFTSQTSQARVSALGVCKYAIALNVFILLTAPGTTHAQDRFVSREYQIKAAYLYNFGKYVEWPKHATIVSDTGKPLFVVGVVGESPIVHYLNQVARRKTVNGMPIVVRQIESASDYRPCHVLFFFTGEDEALIEDVLARTQRTPTMIVGDTPGLLGGRGVTNFYLDGNKVKFEINPAAAKRGGLKVSSKLLRLGRIVGDG